MTTQPSIRPLIIGKYIPPPFGGVEAHIDSLAKALLPEVKCTLLAAQSPAPIAANNDSFPFDVKTVPNYGKFASVFLSPGVLKAGHEELRSKRSNILHIHAPNPWGDFLALSTSKNIPVVMSWHSDIVKQKKLMLAYQHIQKQVLKRVDKIIVFTPMHYPISKQLHQVNIESKIVPIPMGIDFSQLNTSYSNPLLLQTINRFAVGRPVLLTVGRHVYYKGYSHLLSALAKSQSEAVLILIGKGPLTESLKAQAQALKITDRVLFLGEASHADLVTALHRCDVFCLPSIEPSEAFGIASAEAMACGKPTIVCQLQNGVNYLNKEGMTSITTEPKNETQLADAIDTLINNDSLRLKMGQAANNWVRQEFGMEAMKQGTLKLYQSLMP
jgi:glycosyltransferase involved in cell wall biosynthesis